MKTSNETLLAGAARVREQGIHIYQIGPHDWVAAESPDDALTVMVEHYEDDGHYTMDDVEELTPHKLDTLEYLVDGTADGPKHSFRTELFRLAGEGFEFPRHFACTEI